MVLFNKETLEYIELEGKDVRCIEGEQLDGMDAIHTFQLWHTSVVLVPHPGCSNKSYGNRIAYGYFHSVKNITIFDSNLEELPSLHNASRLVSVNLQQNRITSFDESKIPKLNTLYALKLYDNNIMDFPDLMSLGHNSSLTILELSENRISSIPCFPDELKLYNLVKLVINKNHINHICNLNFAPNIIYLDLTNNNLSGNIFMDSTNFSLPNQHTISTNFNKTDLISDFDLRIIPNCKNLEMKKNKIKQFPNIQPVANTAVNVDLRDNFIPNVQCVALDKLEQMMALHLDDNNINYIVYMPSVVHLIT